MTFNLNKQALLIIALIQCSFTFAQKPFVVRGTIPEQYNNQIIKLKIFDYYSNNEYAVMDSTTIINGKFTFKGEVRQAAETAYLNIADKNGLINLWINLLIDSGNNMIRINKVDKDYYVNKLRNIEIINSATNEVFRKKDSIENFYANKFGRDNNNNIISIPLGAQDARQEDIRKLISLHPDNFYSLIFLRGDLNSKYEQKGHVQALQSYNLLTSNLKSSKLGQEIIQLLNEQKASFQASRTGVDVPIFTTKDFKGNEFSNKNLEGKPYLIIFSATWCVPCQKQLPLFKKIYSQYQGRGLEIIYFNMDDRITKWAEHIKKNELKWINVSERIKFRDSKIAKQFNVNAVPTSFLIDKGGKIVYNSDESDIEMLQLEKNIQTTLK